MPSAQFVKRRSDAPPGFFAAEAAGLRWLALAMPAGGVCVATVLDEQNDQIVLERVAEAEPTPSAAEEFGQALAITHAAGATGFGAGPEGGPGIAWIGRQSLPLGNYSRWGAFFAEQRLQPYARAARDIGHLSQAGADAVDRVCERLNAAEFDDDRPPARIHGDLWNGNVVWTAHAARAFHGSWVTDTTRPAGGGGPDMRRAGSGRPDMRRAGGGLPDMRRAGSGRPDMASGVTLIDPAAHGGHGQTDLAMLSLFGLPHLVRVERAYAEAALLPSDWRERMGLHQLHPLLVHAVSHSASYGQHAERLARRYA